METPVVQNAEGIKKDTPTQTEYAYFGPDGSALHTARVEHKNKPLIEVFPYSYNEKKGISSKRISTVELRGWSSFSSLPKLLKPTKNVTLSHPNLKPIMRLLYARYPKLTKLVVTQETKKTRFTPTTATFSFADLEAIAKAVGREIDSHETRRKTAALNGLAAVSTQFSARLTRLPKGGLSNFLSLYEENLLFSESDTDSILALIPRIPFGNVTVTENFIETRNQVNAVFLDGIIERYENLMEIKGDNEKSWQEFFAEHGWLLASVFPYQVILYAREAYVGGKTIENKEGRVVDFLFQNGFKDNYALLEIKTHNKQLVRSTAYRKPAAFALHEDCAGAIAQCLDQKNTFMTEFGPKYRILDPKVALIIGRKGELSDVQKEAFELARNNQKNVDIITFDELHEKLVGLRSILQA